MEKNWLIRTKNNHILGPVSKAKVKELVENGSIKGDDEICSGNGFWFHVREKDLISKFLTGDQSQPFNPVTEAETVLAMDSEANGGASEDGVKFPGGENAQYPDERDDITTVGVDLAELKERASLEEEEAQGHSKVSAFAEGKSKKKNKL